VPEEALSSSTFHPNYSTLLPGITTSPEKEKAQTLLRSILEMNETWLTQIHKKFHVLLDVSGEEANRTTEKINDVVGTFSAQSSVALEAGLQKLNTSIPLCDQLISGIAFWTICTICLVVGLVYLEVSFRIRRRSRGRERGTTRGRRRGKGDQTRRTAGSEVPGTDQKGS
jgi:hypothetical protein